LIAGAKSLFSRMPCTIIFQPHLFSRTKDLADAFAASLDLADKVILLPIYPARELPLPGVTSKIIFDKMKNENKMLLTKEGLLNYMKEAFVPGLNHTIPELLITAGAGDIDALVQPIKAILEKE